MFWRLTLPEFLGAWNGYLEKNGQKPFGATSADAGMSRSEAEAMFAKLAADGVIQE